MNWQIAGFFLSLATLISSIMVGAYVYGKLTQRVDSESKRGDEHSVILKTHGEKLEKHGVSIGRLEEFKDGLKLGSRVGNAKEVS